MSISANIWAARLVSYIRRRTFPSPVIDRPAIRSQSVNMKIAVVLLVVSAVATLADQSHLRSKKDIAPAASNKLCVLADVSKTGKKTVVCGDAAPPTLAMMVAEKSENTKATVAGQDRQSEAKTASARCLGPKPPLKVYVQQPEHHQEQVHYVVPQVQQYVQPQVQYVQPQVQYVQPQIHYEQPQVHVVQPQVHVVEPQVHVLRPQVHYERPQVHYEQAQVHYAQPVKSLCPDAYEQNGGYGGSYYGRSAQDDGYLPVVRMNEPDFLVDDVPSMRTVDIAAIPFEQSGYVRDANDYDTIDARRSAPAVFRYGYGNGGMQDVQMQQQMPVSSFGRILSQQPTFDAILPQTVQDSRYGYQVRSDSMTPPRAAAEQIASRMLPANGAAARDDDDDDDKVDAKSASEDTKTVKQQLPYSGVLPVAKSSSEDAMSTVERKRQA